MRIYISFYLDNKVVQTRSWNYVPRLGDSILIDGHDECRVVKVIWRTGIDGNAAVDVYVVAV